MDDSEYAVDVDFDAIRNEINYVAIIKALAYTVHDTVENDKTRKLMMRIFVAMLRSMKKNGIDADTASKVIVEENLLVVLKNLFD